MSDLTPIVTLVDNSPRVSSLDIAGRFGKSHKDVLRVITRILTDVDQNFGQRNFAPSSYVNEQGKEQPMYSLTRDAFSLVAMGFTGKEALAWKVRYIEAFNAMEKELVKRLAPKRGRKAIGEPLPPAPKFDEAPYLAFVDECRQAHTQAWELEHLVSRKATQLFAPLVVEIQQRASLQNRTWSQFVPDQQWFHAMYLVCKEVMTYPTAQLDDDYNPGMLLLGYVRALNAR